MMYLGALDALSRPIPEMSSSWRYSDVHTANSLGLLRPNERAQELSLQGAVHGQAGHVSLGRRLYTILHD